MPTWSLDYGLSWSPRHPVYVLEQTQDREFAGFAPAYPRAGPHLGKHPLPSPLTQGCGLSLPPP